MTVLQGLDRLMAGLIAGAQWLALPLILLLFLQWPLRDLVRGYSREANDLGQIIFALYVAFSVSAATRAGTHIAADALAQHFTIQTRELLKKIGAGVGLVPWALFVLISGRSVIISSLQLLESFPDTGNPGYFIIKAALWVMAATVLVQSAIDIARPASSGVR